MIINYISINRNFWGTAEPIDQRHSTEPVYWILRGGDTHSKVWTTRGHIRAVQITRQGTESMDKILRKDCMRQDKKTYLTGLGYSRGLWGIGIPPSHCLVADPEKLEHRTSSPGIICWTEEAVGWWALAWWICIWNAHSQMSSLLTLGRQSLQAQQSSRWKKKRARTHKIKYLIKMSMLCNITVT